jgi:hypothetical protein
VFSSLVVAWSRSSGRRLQGAGRDLVGGMLAAARPGLPDRAPAFDPFDRGVNATAIASGPPANTCGVSRMVR